MLSPGLAVIDVLPFSLSRVYSVHIHCVCLCAVTLNRLTLKGSETQEQLWRQKKKKKMLWKSHECSDIGLAHRFVKVCAFIFHFSGVWPWIKTQNWYFQIENLSKNILYPVTGKSLKLQRTQNQSVGHLYNISPLNNSNTHLLYTSYWSYWSSFLFFFAYSLQIHKTLFLLSNNVCREMPEMPNCTDK